MAGYPGVTNYTDLTSTFVYKLLLTHQNMDQLAENDELLKDHMEAEGSGVGAATNPHALTLADIGGGGSVTPGDGTVTQAKLATATGEVSGVGTFTLPGGTYGFYPQTKRTGSTSGAFTAQLVSLGAVSAPSYVTWITLSAVSGTPFAQQRYVTACGKDHWIFLLLDKGKIKAGYQSPDHPCYGTDCIEDELHHPFACYDKDKHEIIVADNSILNKLKSKVSRKKKLLSLLMDECVIDESKKPKYKEREIIEIDEWNDRPGKKIGAFDNRKSKIIQLEPKILILKKRMVKKLPGYIKYRALKLKKG